jgi:hypothetical protein
LEIDRHSPYWGQDRGTSLLQNIMGRIQSSAVLQRKATIAAAREAALKLRTPSVDPTVRKRPLEAYVYSSYMLVDAQAVSERMLVQASAAAVVKFGGAAALLLVDPSTVTTTVSRKPKGFTPAQVHAMVAGTAPTASNTPWKSRVIKYSAATTGTAQAHFVAPVSGDLNATFVEVSIRARGIYTAIKATLGSDDYHRFWFSPEQMNVQEN